MFKKILIANRGEIALRLVRAVQDLGSRGVAVYARDDALAFSAGLQRETRMPIERNGNCTPDLHVSFMVVELAVISGRVGRGFLVTYAVTDEREGDVRPHMGATWSMDRTQALLDAGRSAGGGIRARSPGY